jgi:hypothetical protein
VEVVGCYAEKKGFQVDPQILSKLLLSDLMTLGLVLYICLNRILINFKILAVITIIHSLLMHVIIR